MCPKEPSTTSNPSYCNIFHWWFLVTNIQMGQITSTCFHHFEFASVLLSSPFVFCSWNTLGQLWLKLHTIDTARNQSFTFTLEATNLSPKSIPSIFSLLYKIGNPWCCLSYLPHYTLSPTLPLPKQDLSRKTGLYLSQDRFPRPFLSLQGHTVGIWLVHERLSYNQHIDPVSSSTTCLR